MLRRVWLALLALMLAAGGAEGQVVVGDDVTLDFTGRAQLQFSTTSLGDDLAPGTRPPSTAFETRRIRLGAEFAIQDWLVAEIEGDLGGSGARLTDGFADLALADGFAVRAGQFKKPFGLFELTSSTQILSIERGVRLRGLEEHLPDPVGESQHLLDAGGYIGRDIGVMAHGLVGPVAYAAGVFNGEGANTAETSDSKAYAGRLSVGGDDLVVGAAVSRQPMDVTDAGGEEWVGTAWSVDAEYGAFRDPGPHIMAELMTGDAPATEAGAVTMLGAQAAAGWFVPRVGRVEGIEPVLRASWGDPDREAADDEGLLITPGLNLYFSGRNRLMFNADVYVPSQPALDAEYGLRAQLQVHF